jgi:DNA-directed RNA polymerase specialized sigma24 family protein
VNAQVCEEGAGQPRQFATTRWSLILSVANSRSEEQKARDALEELCRIYWRPVFVFVCRRGYSIEDAQDLTQDFFLKILEPKWLQHADRNRGRFRTFLLTSLQNFLVKAAEKTHTQKRGGDVKFISWDDWMAERTGRRDHTGLHRAGNSLHLHYRSRPVGALFRPHRERADPGERLSGSMARAEHPRTARVRGARFADVASAPSTKRGSGGHCQHLRMDRERDVAIEATENTRTTLTRTFNIQLLALSQFDRQRLILQVDQLRFGCSGTRRAGRSRFPKTLRGKADVNRDLLAELKKRDVHT